MRITPQEAITHVKTCLFAGLVPMISGDPGVGKSDIVKQVFNAFNLKLIDIRLTQYDPTEMNGLFRINDAERATHTPFDTFPLEKDPVPDGYDGWGIFFDEFNSAPQAVQAAAYKVVLDRMVGQYKLNKRVKMICAGNLASNNAIVQRMSTAMQSRLVHLEVGTDIEQWISWANENKIDHRIIAYIQNTPDNLHKFNPDHDDKTFACPRTWFFASQLIKRTPGDIRPLEPLLAGAISEAVATEFILYTNIYNDIPDIQTIMANPDKIQFKQDPGVLYALSNMVAAWLKPDNTNVLIQFIQRLPIEFTTITLQNAIKRNKKLCTVPEILEWINLNAPGLFN